MQLSYSVLELPIPVEISSRHIHLSKEDVERLYGEGYKLTKLKDLSQPGEFACAETVTLIGAKGSISNVRVVGPCRDKSQVELSITDCFKLGIKAPVRLSGDVENTPGIELMNENGTRLMLANGVIVAMRHLHLSPLTAMEYGLEDRQAVSVEIEGSRGGIFSNVIVRVGKPATTACMHLDTDEGNGFGVRNGTVANIIVDKTQFSLVAK